jgi:translation initiation factor IF-2
LSTLKVFEIARELGIDSKEIIAKCKAEDIPKIDSYRSPVSVGLAATIREWFSTAAPKTAVETTAHVDVEKVKRKRPSKSKSATTTEAVETPETTEAAIKSKATGRFRAKAESPEAPPAESPEGGVATESPPAHAAAAAAIAPAPAKPEPSPPEVPVKPVKPILPPGPRGVPNVVHRPLVTAGGPRNVPTPAQLQGPKVVRVEAPEAVAQPRARVRPAVGPGSIAPMMEPPPLPTPSSGSHRGKSRQNTEVLTDDEEGKARLKGRSVRRNSGRTADASIDLIREWREADLLDRAERLASATGGMLRERRREISKSQQRLQQQHAAPAQRPTSIEITPPVSVRELSELMGVKSSELLKKLMAQGAMLTVNQPLATDVAQLLAVEFGVELVIKPKESLYATLDREFREREEKAEKFPRPPVVTVLGHVDHGKTSLLDKIRSTNVAAGEAGGITQHVGAYTVSITGSDGKPKRVTFLDTPGHQAFTAMRARGANMTDVVVLVVAADDGVMPQTIESINHAKAAGVPIVVALNKIDKTEANPNKVLGQLAEQGLNPVEWGGDVEVVRTSALSGQGVKELIEYLDYVAALRELKAPTDVPSRGTVIEAFMDPLRGVVARVMVRSGMLHVGDTLVCGSASGRIRQLLDDKGKSLSEAAPASPVEVIGLDTVPAGGDPFFVVDDLSQAKSIAEERSRSDRETEIAQRNKVTLDNLFDTIKKGEIKELNVILKADVQGSVDVLRQTLTEELSKEVQVKLLHAAVGGISESDVLLADASNAIIVGFSVAPDETARKLAERLGVDIRLYRIIYEISDDIRKALTGMLSPEKQEQVLGHAEVRQVIKISRVGNVAGCMVTDGVLQRNNKYRLIREGVVVTDNLQLDSLKRFKEDVREVRGGIECGIKIAGYDDLKVGDRIEAYRTVDVARTL